MSDRHDLGICECVPGCGERKEAVRRMQEPKPLGNLGYLVLAKRGRTPLRAVAKQIGISAPTLSRIEHGGAPDIGTFGKLCRWLEVDPAALLEVPEPVPSRPVTGPLKQAFADWIDRRTAQGVETYGQPLATHNGRDAERDMLEELLDFCQYQQQRLMELEDEVRALRP